MSDPKMSSPLRPLLELGAFAVAAVAALRDLSPWWRKGVGLSEPEAEDAPACDGVPCEGAAMKEPPAAPEA